MCTSFRSIFGFISTRELIIIHGSLTGYMTITRSDTIPTEAETCVKMIVLLTSREYLLVNKLVSTVNRTTFTSALSWKNPSASFRRLIS